MTEPLSPIMIDNHERALLTQCRHYSPHSVYGWHPLENGNAVVRTRQIGAKKVELVAADGTTTEFQALGDDIFGLEIPGGATAAYGLRITWASDAVTNTFDCQ